MNFRKLSAQIWNFKILNINWKWHLLSYVCFLVVDSFFTTNGFYTHLFLFVPTFLAVYSCIALLKPFENLQKNKIVFTHVSSIIFSLCVWYLVTTFVIFEIPDMLPNGYWELIGYYITDGSIDYSVYGVALFMASFFLIGFTKLVMVAKSKMVHRKV